MKPKLIFLRILCLAAGLVLAAHLLFSSSRAAPGGEACAPLPPPTGTTVEVSSIAGLQNAVNSAAPGVTILVDDGVYALNGAYLRITAPNVTLRSKSGNREAVVLDGGYVTTEIVQVVASGVTIADLTLKRAVYHPIHVTASDTADTLNTRIYNVHVIDPGQQAIKINQNSALTHFTDYGEVACARIELTDAGRPHISNCYTGGIDGHRSRGWVIQDNSIEGFWCQSGLAEHAIHFWTGSRDTLIERNSLKDNARGIGLGLGQSGADWRTYADSPCPGVSGAGHYRGTVRNNMVFASRAALFSSGSGFDCGICLEQACNVSVLHNTVVSTQNPFSSIEWRFPLTSIDLYNNLVSYNLRERDGATASQAGNLQNASLSLFANGAGGDLHLAGSASQAINKGVTLAAGLSDDDYDGDLRPIGSARDIGADEYGIPAPAAVADLRLSQAVAAGGTLSGTLSWSPPAGATAADIKYAYSPINDANWASAASLPGPISVGAGVYGASAPYTTGTIFFAMKVQGPGGWSKVSNNVFWPHRELFFPSLQK